MEICYREYSRDDSSELSTLSDDMWSVNHESLANPLCQFDDKTEKFILAIHEGKIIGYIYGFTLPNKVLIPDFSIRSSRIQEPWCWSRSAYGIRESIRMY